MRRNKTFNVAGQRVRARDEGERTAKLDAWTKGCHRDLLDADFFLRLPFQQVINNRESVDRLLASYFGAIGFEPEESRIEPEYKGQFVKYAGLTGIEVGTITVGDAVYLAARPLQDPADQTSAKTLAWLDKVMTTAKQAANHMFERNELKDSHNLPAVLAYRDPDGGFQIEECGWVFALSKQSKMVGADYTLMPKDEFATWLKQMDDNYDVTDEAWGAGELLIKMEADEIAVIFDGDRYRFLDADVIGTPSRAEYIGNLWRERYQGFVLAGAHELVEAEERLPEWLTATEKERVMRSVNQSLRALFYGADLHPGMTEITRRFTHIADTDLFQALFREVNAGNIRFQINEKTGRVEVDSQDAVNRLEEVFKAGQDEVSTTELQIDSHNQRKGICV